MRDEVEHLLGSFQLTLTDSELSPGEKLALRQLLAETDLSEEEKAFLRNRLFDLAHNDAALAFLSSHIEARRWNLIIAQPANRTWSDGLQHLAQRVKRVIAPFLEAMGARP